MKIVTWNFGFGSPGSPSLNNKDKVVEALCHASRSGCDVVLAQEICALDNLPSVKELYPYFQYATCPKDRPEGGHWGGKTGIDAANEADAKKWGTAVLSKDPLVSVPLAINSAYPGTMLLVKDEKRGLGLVSIYGKRVAYEGYVENLHRCISDLTAALGGAEFTSGFILAGDMNIGDLRNEKISARSIIVINRLYDLGFRNCCDENSPYACTYHGGTREDRESRVDWVFASKKLRSRLHGYAWIDASAGTKALSDHYPIIAELNI